jgi:hypothetical protein
MQQPSGTPSVADTAASHSGLKRASSGRSAARHAERGCGKHTAGCLSRHLQEANGNIQVDHQSHHSSTHVLPNPLPHPPSAMREGCTEMGALASPAIIPATKV